MYEIFSEFLKNKKRVSIIQAENPDADSVGSALALEQVLKDIEVSLYCPVEMPGYLRYMKGIGRVSLDFDYAADGYIIVDTAATVLISKILEDTAARDAIFSKPVLVIDHHETADDLEFPHEAIVEILPSCTNLIYRILKEQGFKINAEAAEYIYDGMASDTLGFTSASVTAETHREIAELIDLGVDVSSVEEARKEFMKKSQRILAYKAELINRIEYHLDGALATIHIPWEDIEEYSHEYNPNVLILEEMRMVEGVKVAVAIKTYPDGRVTGKIRSSVPVAEQVAGYFGGGGHQYAAGFRTYDTDYMGVVRELVKCCLPLIENDESV